MNTKTRSPPPTRAGQRQPRIKKLTKAVAPRVRLTPEERESDIVRKAIPFFAQHGFAGSTRELALHLGVSQALMYRYFPTKEALVERVYEEVFLRQWNPQWQAWLADRSVSLPDRLKRYYKDYASYVITSEWVRIFIFAGLMGADINQRFMTRLREQHLMVIARELRHTCKLPDPPTPEDHESEIELIWAMHASVFHLGIRKWIYGMPAPKNIDQLIEERIDAFLIGVPSVIAARRLDASREGAAE